MTELIELVSCTSYPSFLFRSYREAVMLMQFGPLRSFNLAYLVFGSRKP
jgi:hypothetical protein